MVAKIEGPTSVAGYVVVSPSRPAPDSDAGLPDPFLTISDCLADGLVTPELSPWFQDLDEALAARGAAPGALLLAVGLHAVDASEFTHDLSHEPRHFELLRTGASVPPAATPRGYEIVGAEYGGGLHSWHCHGYSPTAELALGVRLNADGLLDRHDEATTVLEWMLDGPRHPAPVPWTIVSLSALPS